MKCLGTSGNNFLHRFLVFPCKLLVCWLFFTVGVAVRSTTASVTLTRRGRQITSSGFYFRKQNWRKPEELEKSILGFLTISKAVRSRDAWNLLFSGSSKYEKGLKIRFSGGITVGKSIDFFYLRRRFYRGFSSCSDKPSPFKLKERNQYEISHSSQFLSNDRQT